MIFGGLSPFLCMNGTSLRACPVILLSAARGLDRLRACTRLTNAMERLQKAADEEVISAYYWRVIMDMSKKVLENIARKYDNVKEGVESIMGGHVLEHEGKKIYNAGKEAGMQAGEEKGKKEGVIETLASLVRDKLLSITEAAKRANMTQSEFEKAAGL